MNSMKYKYRFVGHGVLALGPRNDRSVMVDVGNMLCPGVFDHHQFVGGTSPSGGSGRSTSSLVPGSMHLIPNDIDTFITHRAPDFDAWLAVWLIQYVHENKSLPPCHEKVIDYVTKLDAGLMQVDRYNLRTPVAVAASIPLTLEGVAEDRAEGVKGSAMAEEPAEVNGALESEQETGQTLDERLMLRGLALVEYMFRRLWTLPEMSRELDIPYFMEPDCPFEAEIRLAREDLARYHVDFMDNACTEQTSIRVRNTRTGANEHVDALIWKKPPGCELHKHWARSDTHAPRGAGFVMTIIPQRGMCGIIDPSGHVRNRVILSVNPNTPYDLYGLAKELERLELMKEEIAYGNAPSGSRRGEMISKGSHPRFPDDWCTNDDPWYDGRSDGYTIVDSPRRYSLLSLDEMADAAGRFTIPKVKATHCRVVYPFSFHAAKTATGYDRLCGALALSDHATEIGLEALDVPKDAFYAHFRDYLHLSGPADPGNTGNCRIFRDTAMELVSHLILFSYGIGFAVMDYGDIRKDCVSGAGRFDMEELLAFNADRVFASEQVHSVLRVAAGDLGVSFQVEEGLIYCVLNVDDAYLGKEDTEKTLYQICNLKSYKKSGHAYFQNEIEYAATSVGTFQMKINANISYGFGKAGGCLLLKDNENSDIFARQQCVEYEKHFMSVDFVSFLFSLHQRTCLASLSSRLSVYAGKRRNAALVRNLRYFIMEFIAKGWSSQISRNELNMEVYGRWGKTFETTGLFNEVNAQLKSYEDYLSGERNRKIGMITSLFVPVSLFEIFFSINMLGKAQNGQLIRNIPWYASLGIIVMLVLLLLSFISIGRKRRRL